MIRAIVIDDERASYGVISYIIEHMNMPITLIGHFRDGQSGWNAIKTMTPDMIFLDIQMPGINGVELMKKIKNEYDSHINIIVITAYDNFEYAQAALRYGARDILLKPIDRKDFTKSIESVIGYHITENTLINELIEYIHCHYGEDIFLKDCAEKFHTSSQHISRLFKKYMSKSFINYLNEHRISQAKILLEETNLSIKEIASQV
ncbi:MAG: response regulator, partial [Clostridiales bacterium]|nr:response regulator [Clostridiales bacterium]